MSHAEKCPVCDGKGLYPKGGKNKKSCHGCKGKGWVEVGDVGGRPYMPYIPYVPPVTDPVPLKPFWGQPPATIDLTSVGRSKNGCITIF